MTDDDRRRTSDPLGIRANGGAPRWYPGQDPIDKIPPDSPKWRDMQFSCPFLWCGLTGKIITPGLPYAMIKQHNMALMGRAEQEGTEPCPASLMPYPLRPDAVVAMLGQEQAMSKRKSEEQTEYRMRQVEAKFKERYGKDPFGPSVPTDISQLLGRRDRPRPPHDDPSWSLGGRADEDIVADDPVAERRKAPRTGDHTSTSGTGASGMASLNELAGLINSTGAHGAEARVSLEEAIAALERAASALVELLGDSSSETINEYYGMIRRAISECQSAQQQIDAGQDRGQEFVARLFS